MLVMLVARSGVLMATNGEAEVGGATDGPGPVQLVRPGLAAVSGPDFRVCSADHCADQL